MAVVGRGGEERHSEEASRLSEAWARLAYRYPFRTYQARALEALERREGQAGRFHVVAPPGSGKTVLGLEIVRRFAQPTLVLCPNTAIRGQWRRQLADFLAPGVTLPPCFVGDEPGALAPLMVLTYQALCNLSDPEDLLAAAALGAWRSELQATRQLTDEEVAAEEARLRQGQPAALAREVAQHEARLKRALANSADAHLLELLHPNARRLVDGLRRGGYRTVVLDECHHLCSLWGYVVRDLVRALGDDTLVVGLTSTPPADLSGDEFELYRGLLGDPSFQVPTPAVVREGHLAPYQELAHFVTPLPSELEFIASRHVLFQELVTRVLDVGFASRSLTEWVIDRVRHRESGPAATAGQGGARLSFVAFARQHPALARAAVRFLHAGGQPLPPEAHLSEQLRQPPTIDDWVVLLEDYCLRCLRPSPAEADAAALRQVRQALIGLGYVLTRTGIRTYVSPVDRVLALSAAKEIAAARILRLEDEALGDQLRALVICDYETLGSPVGADLAAVLDRQAGSALRLLSGLIADQAAGALSPMLVTGTGVRCAAGTAARFAAWLAERGEDVSLTWGPDPAAVSGRRHTPTPGLESEDADPGLAEQLVRLVGGPGWQPSRFVPLVTAYFGAGHCRCLVGTRALLGEGWDAPRANTLLDLTTATTHTSMHQLRGRTLRLDPAWPEKVANNWDVVCVADLPKGGGDYARFVRKHRSYYGLTADGAIESGVTHVHPTLSPYAPPPTADLPVLNAALLRRAARRDDVRAAWRIGAPYANQEVPTVRVRWSRPLGIGPRPPREAAGLGQPERLGRQAALALVGSWGLAGVGLALGAPGLAALGIGAALSAGAVARFVSGLGAAFQRIPTELALDGCARAVLAALQEAGQAPTSLGPDAIQIAPRSDGYYRCYLAGAPAEASRLFAECLEDLLAPVENQRYVIPRYWAELPASGPGRALFVLRSLAGGAGLYRVQYHPVPDYFAINRARVLVFTRHWNRHVSPGQPIYAYSESAGRLLAAERGRNAFGVLSQLRSIWE